MEKRLEVPDVSNPWVNIGWRSKGSRKILRSYDDWNRALDEAKAWFLIGNFVAVETLDVYDCTSDWVCDGEVPIDVVWTRNGLDAMEIHENDCKCKGF